MLLEKYKIIDGLVLKVALGVDILNTTQDYYAPSTTGSPAGSSTGYAAKGYASIGAGNEVSWLNENTLTYDHTFEKNHFLNLLLGNSTQYEQDAASVAIAQNSRMI